VWTQIDRGGARDAGFEVMAPFIYTNPKGVPVYVVRRGGVLLTENAVIGTYTAIPDFTVNNPLDNAVDIGQKTCATAQPQQPFFALTCQPGFILVGGPDSKPRSVETYKGRIIFDTVTKQVVQFASATPSSVTSDYAGLGNDYFIVNGQLYSTHTKHLLKIYHSSQGVCVHTFQCYPSQ